MVSADTLVAITNPTRPRSINVRFSYFSDSDYFFGSKRVLGCQSDRE